MSLTLSPTTFTPLNSTLGGFLLALPVFHKARLHGRVTGISGTLRKALSFHIPSISFLLGLYLSGLLLSSFRIIPDTISNFPVYISLAAGLFVGSGTTLANGCTSGHALCGLARRSKRSLVATVVFMAVAIIVATSTGVMARHGADVNKWEGGLSTIGALVFFGAIVPPMLAVVWKRVGHGMQSVLESLMEFVMGFSFGAGLIVAGMTAPKKVAGFLDIASGEWDPSLLFVFVGALPVVSAGFWPLLKGESPVLNSESGLPKTGKVDWRLIGGSALFGTGWGLVGVCPGPAIVYAGGVGNKGIASLLIGIVVGGAFVKLGDRLNGGERK